jgi:Zn-dependent peptidase ImmA (M78 family)
MSDDRRVKGRDNEEIRRHAENSKVDYRVDRIYPVNILRILRSGSVQTLFGRKKLIFEVAEDEDLGTVDAKTEFSASTVTITCKRCVELRANLGVGRDRMTLAHELGHAVMHSGEAAFRYSGASGTTSISATNAYESAEHQAKTFASAFLIHDREAAGMTAKEISEQFGVSLEAAELCFDRLLKKAERARSAERVMRMNDEVKAALLGPKQAQARYLGDVCGVCKKQTLVPRGTQVECETCGFKGDRFQDGDNAA